MKKTFLKFMMAASVLGTVMTSCNSDDDANTNTCSDGIKNGDETGVDCGGSSCQPCALAELEGELSNELTLDASIAYELKGKFEVLDGGKLTIPAGTVIKATGGTASYIAVAQGGQIFVNGTASNPVVMTSGETAPEAGNWGGLVVCGNAPTNKGASVTSEVAGLTYGGTATDDNSGSIRYLRLEYTGAEFSADKQFNGLSLFGVGSGTTVEYVQSYNGKDDGIEFFGGTVNGKYLVSTNAGDDGIDFADGWNGNGEFWYVSGSAKAGLEGSNLKNETASVDPVTTTTLSNITVVGPVGEGALFYKEGGGNFTIDNFYTSGVNKGVSVKDSDIPAKTRIEAGNLVITNMEFANVADGFAKTDYTGANQSFISEGVATGAGNGAAAPDWAAGWTRGLDNSGVTESSLEGEINYQLNLDASVAYELKGKLEILDGGKLIIPAGTVIKATGGTASYIAVAQGGQIFVNGTASNPVVMTSGAATPEPGNWGGLVVCGNAPTNKGASVTSEVAGLTYGGTVTDDNSGSITYLRLEYTGAEFSAEKQFNGLSLFGVGSGTTVEYVQSYNGKDDGIEFFGGTVNGKYLVSTNAGDDGIDFADGWNGNGEFWYVSGSAKAGLEGSNLKNETASVNPVTTTTLSNITVVGPVTEGALFYKEGGGNFTIDNFYTSGVNKGISVKDSDTPAATRIEAGNLVITNIQFDAKATGFVETDYTGAKQDFYTEGTATGAGNGAAAPDWAAGWTVGL
ncbi:hypothetical protein AX016_1282 [Cellulophaga sp. RHA19]|uniref:hypothetical protein n=1 Tax=Cellulophaga sp. RHA19 TaxID=1798237 RepID=UPI000CCAB0FF|nr:hypothetical protein [Cellulophaga sp. RHA19]PKB43099.1 hypothetical protein AX016_1282 [Cellulophaga sp. RHA19]